MTTTYTIPNHLTEGSLIGNLVAHSGAKVWTPNENRMVLAIHNRLYEAHCAMGNESMEPRERAERYNSIAQALDNGDMIVTTSKEFNIECFKK